MIFLCIYYIQHLIFIMLLFDTCCFFLVSGHTLSWDSIVNGTSDSSKHAANSKTDTPGDYECVIFGNIQEFHTFYYMYCCFYFITTTTMSSIVPSIYIPINPSLIFRRLTKGRAHHLYSCLKYFDQQQSECPLVLLLVLVSEVQA